MFNPKENYHTIVLNGRTDNRNYKQEKTSQYEASEVLELMLGEEEGSCALATTGLEPRFGLVAGFVNNTVICWEKIFFRTTVD